MGSTGGDARDPGPVAARAAAARAAAGGPQAAPARPL